MHKDCKVAVLVPIYNETISTILYSLTSLANQTADKKFYSVFCLVNNSLSQAKENKKEFKQNQKTLLFLKYLKKQAQSYNGKITKAEKQNINKILKSNLQLFVIDKSSQDKAEEINNVGAARDIGALEICSKFITSTKIKSNGIIGLIDCDCKVSPNYIEQLIKTFADTNINGGAGKWLVEIEKKIKHKKTMELMLQKHLHKNVLFKYQKNSREIKKIRYQKKEGLPYYVLINGQNMVIRVKAWLEAGGMPHLNSFEDLILGAKVTDLPGDVIYNPNYTVTTLARASDRVGMNGLGRRMHLFAKAAFEYHSGKSADLYVPKLNNLFQFFVKVFVYNSRTELNIRSLKLALLAFGAETYYLSQENLEEILKLIKNEFLNKQDLVKTQSALEKLYHIFPKTKVL